ncbi:MAG TPA: DinB family protein [Longimicrobiaceae bacterium]|nr:DinB family protein [Longimicrobiaceae bacterium]
MQMQRSVFRLAAPALAAAALALAVPAAAQQQHAHHDAPVPTSGIRAELIRDVQQLEQKYLSLADAMTGKYAWRPAEGVRSVGEVFAHVAGANLMLPMMVGVAPPESMPAANLQEAFGRMQTLERETDEGRVKEALRHSFMHIRHAIAAVPDDQLDGMVKVFGQDASRRAALNLLVTHMHEHLGQSIAYARSNGVVPPWSAGGGD